MTNKEKSFSFFGAMYGMMFSTILHLIMEQKNHNEYYVIILIVSVYIAAHFYKKYQTLKDEN
jgi:H+/Cl- antiporter ClcA